MHFDQNKCMLLLETKKRNKYLCNKYNVLILVIYKCLHFSDASIANCYKCVFKQIINDFPHKIINKSFLSNYNNLFIFGIRKLNCTFKYYKSNKICF